MATSSVFSRDSKALAPATKAFVLAYLSIVAPQALPLLISIVRRGKLCDAARNNLEKVLRDGLSPYRLPSFAAILVGGSLGLQKPIYQALYAFISRTRLFSSKLTAGRILLIARFLAALLSACLGFGLLNSQRSNTRSSTLDIQNANSPDASPTKPRQRRSKIPENIPKLPVGIESRTSSFSAQGVPLAGQTIDLTLFAATRAIDAVFQTLPAPKQPRLNKIWRVACKWSSPALFAASSATIMQAFFYAPSRLPFTYSRWIMRIAGLDERLLEALRQARFGNFVYGKDTGIAPLLGSMARDLNLPEEWGDPAVTIPVPCELVHHGASPSCEGHAIWRLLRGIKVALGVYAPLQALLLLRRLSSKGTNKRKAIMAAARDSLQSATFLGAFVALFYYGVCLTRTRLGPRILGRDRVSRQMFDSGLCVLGGCGACGLSVLVEGGRRQTELMLFVWPRALGVWLPRRYPRSELWKEQLAFAVSVAVVMTAAQEKRRLVRGVFGGILGGVLEA